MDRTQNYLRIKRTSCTPFFL